MDLSISMFSGEERQRRTKSRASSTDPLENRESKEKILYPGQDIYIYGVVGEDVPD
jgi:hypothetical protein